SSREVRTPPRVPDTIFRAPASLTLVSRSTEICATAGRQTRDISRVVWGTRIAAYATDALQDPHGELGAARAGARLRSYPLPAGAAGARRRRLAGPVPGR